MTSETYSAETDLTSLVQSLALERGVHDQQQLLKQITLIESFLRDEKQRDKPPATQEAAIQLRHFLAEAVLPPDTFAERSSYAIEDKATLTPDDIAKYHLLSYRGLLCLSHLQSLVPLRKDGEDLAVIWTCIAAFSDPSDPWTSQEAFEEASGLIDRLRWSLSQGVADFADLLALLLRDRIKPAFAKQKNRKITQQARKAIDPLPTTSAAIDDEPDSKPWKYRQVYLVTVLGWILRSLSLFLHFVDNDDPNHTVSLCGPLLLSSIQHKRKLPVPNLTFCAKKRENQTTFIETNWPFIVPPLLALIDDSSIKYKAAGCAKLSTFLQTCPSTTLERTGLGEVFENAVMLCLMYFPSPPEEQEPLLLLDQAYRALLQLARVRFSGVEQRTQKVKMLDKIMRYGVLQGYAHAGEHVQTAVLLVRQMGELTEEMGIDVVKHLKHVLTILSAIMANPFSTAYPPLLEASVKSLQIVMTTAWPRVDYHRGEILKALTVCWLRIQEDLDSSTELKKIRREIEKTMQMLTALMNQSSTIVEEYQLLVASDSRLQELLKIK
ncbi:MAG: hypothetical protein Q9163_000886 [Psora crenata]